MYKVENLCVSLTVIVTKYNYPAFPVFRNNVK